MRCQECRAKVKRGDLFCPECGEKISKEARTITVWNILKVVLVILSFFIIIHVFKNTSGAQPIILLILILLFVIWSGVLNWFLQKLFNVKISTGVKIAITAVIILILFYGIKIATQKTTPMMNRIVERQPTGEDETMMYSIIEEINSAFNHKNDNTLKSMIEKGVVTGEVFEDLKNMLFQSGSLTIILKPQNNRLSDTHAEIDTEVILKHGYEERRQGTVLVFEKRGSTWTLIKISPRLSDIKLEESFQIALETEIEETVSVDDGLACVTEPGKAIYGDSEKCCGGLKPMFGYEDSNGKCQCTEEGNNCGGASICAPCGNGVCEKEYREDRCTCPEDC